MTTGGQYLGQEFGGEWTRLKLDILREYLNAYTTALKFQFQLLYLDAFAGTGEISARSGDPDARLFISGSAQIAIDTTDKPFSQLIFVEKDPERHEQLQQLARRHPNRAIRVENAEANTFLREFLSNLAPWRGWRGVLFLDPFATEVEWSTVEAVANSRFLDLWILFPTYGISRMLPTSRRPENVSEEWANRLNRIYGGSRWRELYRLRPQLPLFGEQGYERDPGTEGLSRIYREQLSDLFGNRYMNKTKVFVNSNNSPLFEFMFCVGSPSSAAVRLAKEIAGHILDASE